MNKEQTNSPRMMTTKQVADLLGIPVQTVRTWRQTGRGPRYHKFEGSIRYSREVILDYINNTERRGTQAN